MYNILGNVIYYSVGFLIFLILLAIVASYEKLRYYIKLSVYTAALIIPASLHCPFMFLRIGDWRNLLLTGGIVKTVVKLLGVTYHIRGKENILKDSGSVVLLNHQSILDLGVTSELCPILERCTVIAKKAVLHYGPFGLAAWLSGVIFIDRRNSSEAQKTLKAAAKHIRDIKANVFIFPEGHRHSNSTLLPFKKGAFHLAIDSQLPILPITVSKYYFLNSKRKIFNSGTCYVTILPPISTEGLTKEDLPRLWDDTYRIMNKTFVETSQEAINQYINSFEDGK